MLKRDVAFQFRSKLEPEKIQVIFSVLLVFFFAIYSLALVMASILSSLDNVLALGSCGLDCNTNVCSASRQVACAGGAAALQKEGGPKQQEVREEGVGGRGHPGEHSSGCAGDD